jgi:hypothetical protein
LVGLLSTLEPGPGGPGPIRRLSRRWPRSAMCQDGRPAWPISRLCRRKCRARPGCGQGSSSRGWILTAYRMFGL